MNFLHHHSSPLDLPRVGDLLPERHVFDPLSVSALNAAIATNRPLLVRGEPGVGKSQLARAAATALNVPLQTHVVDSKTEPHDLLWHFDAIQRLAEAQILHHLDKKVDPREHLAVRNFIYPGPLWWAFDWASAERQATNAHADRPEHPQNWEPSQGVVLLIDEIDKAESDVPNGLLEALGSGRFKPHGMPEPVTIRGASPLVVVTTNEERAMPDAFVRRCLVLNLSLPNDSAQLGKLLVERGRAHFPDMEEGTLAEAAALLCKDRQAAVDAKLKPLPGQAEYLDFLRAMARLPKGASDSPKLVAELQRFIYQKNRLERL